MNQHSQRVLSRMISFIDLYLEAKIGLAKLVNDLEGSKNALEEELPDSFYPNWYEHWGNLEMQLAVFLSEGTEPEHKLATKNATLLKEHIQSLLDDVATSD